MNLLYQLIILPIESTMKLILESFYFLSNNYGLSIILLSLTINILLLPIYYLADKWKNTDKKLQETMDKEISLIKKNYKGKERHYYIKAIYKRYNYHPISSIKASMGFLIQIPFFFSAFVLLSNYPPLNNISFLIFDNLNSPDGLLWGINLLPFVMTIINIASALIYASSSNKSEKIQLYTLSFVFLVLLYTSSVALLLYWTFNNIFSFFKNLIEDKYDLSKQKEFLINGLIYFSKKIWSIFNNVFMLLLLFFLYPLINFYSSNFALLHFDISALLFVFIETFIVYFVFIILNAFFDKKKVLRTLYQFLFLYFLIMNRNIIKDYFEMYSSLENALLFITILIISIGLPLILKIKKSFFVLILILLNTISFHSLLDKSNKKLINNKEVKTIKDSFVLKNNVYFLLEDGYSGFNALKNGELFDNSPFYKDLKNLGLKAYPNAFSNYPRTYSSMKAIFEIKHHKLKNVNVHTTRFPLQSFTFTGCNKVFKSFQENNYQIFNNNKKNIKNINCKKVIYDNHTYQSNEPREDVLFYFEYIAFKKFKKTYKWMKKELGVELFNKTNYEHYFTNLLSEIPKSKSNQFIYMHSFTTIDPTTCNKNKLEEQLTTKGYLRQLKCANKDIIKTIKEIHKRDTDPIIVLMSDHASVWRKSFVSNKKNDIPYMSFNILQAYKWPKQCSSFNEIPSISPINTFNYVFACLTQNDKYIKKENLQSADSYTINKWNLGMKYDKIDKINAYKIIKNNHILNTPLKISQ